MSDVPTVVAIASATASSQPGEPVRVGPAVPLAPGLAGVAAAIGHGQVTADSADGVARLVPAVVETPERQIVPALSLAALAVGDGTQPRPILRSRWWSAARGSGRHD